MSRTMKTALVLGMLFFAGCDSRFDFEPDVDGGTVPSASKCTVEEGCGASGLFCQAAASVCVVCLDDSACGSSRCNPDGRCVECVQDAHCGAQERCDLSTFRCVRACNDNDQCPEPRYRGCDKDIGFCAECKEDEHCPNASKPYCELSNGLCAVCASDAHCATSPASPKCDRTQGTCVQCLGPSDCPPATPDCDTATGLCRAR